MINVLVTLAVKDFTALRVFEKKAAVIMIKYQGRIISAFETIRNSKGTGEEIHILEFPNEEAFANYRADKSLSELANLRCQAIESTEVKVSLCVKSYL